MFMSRLRCLYDRQFHGRWVPDVLSEHCHLCWYAPTSPTCYAVYTYNPGLYIFFKISLKSKVVSLKEIDFQSEFDAIENEKLSGEYVPESNQPWWKRFIHWV